MVQASWTYELPATGTWAENLDDYEARSADGAHLGVVSGLVDRAGDRYLLVDAGRLPPFLHRRLAIRWDDVAAVDHDALVVELAVDRTEIEAKALLLDPALARHDATADAARIHDLPAELAQPAPAGAAGPVDGTSAFVLIALASLGPWSLLVIVAFWSTRGLHGWELASFAAPVLLTVLTIAVGGYRLFRERHLGHGRRG